MAITPKAYTGLLLYNHVLLSSNVPDYQHVTAITTVNPKNFGVDKFRLCRIFLLSSAFYFRPWTLRSSETYTLHVPECENSSANVTKTFVICPINPTRRHRR